MKLVISILGVVGLVLLLASSSDAAIHAQGNHYNGWAVDAGNELLDDGTGGDATAGDGIFSRIITSTVTAGDYDFKIHDVDADLWWPTSNVWLTLTSDFQDVLFTFDTNAIGDGWFPNQNVVWSDAIRPGTAWGLVGDGAELGNWNPPDGPAATFDGSMWVVEVTFAGPGVHPYKWTADQIWDTQQLGDDGYGSNAQNTVVNVVEAGTLEFKYDPATGRGFVGAPPPPPATWHARGSYYYNWIPDDGNLLNDMGVNGDAAADDGIFSGFVVSSEPAGEYRFKAGKNDWSEGYPNSDVPMTTNVDNQVVFFTLNTNSQGDGWYPDANIVYSDAVTPGTTWGLAGGAPELGNWEPADGPQATLVGGIWEVVVDFAVAGDYEFKWTADLVWNVMQLGFDGWGSEASNIQLNVPEPGGVIFQYDPSTGRATHDFAPPVATIQTTWGRVKDTYR